MDMIGTWKVVKAGVFSMETGFEMKALEEIMAMEDTEEIQETKEMASAMFLVVTEDEFQMRMFMPQEAIEEAKAEGEEIPFNEDGSVTVESYPWKVEDDQVFFLQGDEGEIFGEAIDPWQKVEFDENGNLIMGMLAFAKA